MPSIFSDLLEPLWGTLVNASLQIAILSLVAMLGLWALRQSPSTLRHRWLTYLLIACLSLPLLNCLSPIDSIFWNDLFERRNAIALDTLNIADSMIDRPNPMSPAREEVSKSTEPANKKIENQDRSPLPAEPAISRPKNPSSEVSMTLDVATFKTICVIAWLVGIVVLATRMLDDQRRLRKLQQQSRLSCSESVESVANELMSTFRLKNLPCILESDQALTPMTWGILRPTVLFPNTFGQWPFSFQRSAFLHELAHIRRRDILWQLLVRIFCVLFWFHPSAWWLKRKLHDLCENACDDFVIESGVSASSYAEALLFVARRTRHAQMSASIAMAQSHSLSSRITLLLDSRVSHTARNRRATIVTAALLALAATMAAVAFQPLGGLRLSLLSSIGLNDDFTKLDGGPGTDMLGDPLTPGARLQFGTKRFRPPGNVAQMILSPDDNTVVTLCDYLTVWDAKTGKALWRVPSETAKLRSSGAAYGNRPIAFSKDSQSFYTAGSEKVIMQWYVDGSKPKRLARIRKMDSDPNNARMGGTSCIDVAQDDELFAVGYAAGAAVVDASGKELFRISNGPAPAPDDPGPDPGRDRLAFFGGYCLVKFSPDGNQLACILSEAPKEIRLVDSQSGQEVRRIPLTGNAVRIDYSPDGNQIVATERDQSTRLYDVATGNRIWAYTAKLTNPYENYMSDVDFSPDGAQISVCATDNRLYLLDATNGQELGTLTGHAWYPWSVQFTSDSQRLFSSGWDGKIRRWDLSSKKELPLEQGEYASSVIASSPDGKKIAVAYDSGRVSVVSTDRGQEITSIPMGTTSPSQVAFSADSQMLAIGGANDKNVVVSVWNLHANEESHRWEWELGRDPHSHVEAISFSPNGTRLAAAVFRQDKLYLWDLKSKTQVAAMDHDQVYGLDFHADGETLVSVGWDTHLREWNAETGDLEVDLDLKVGQEDLRMYGVTCSSAGDLVATAHMNATVKIWNREDMSLRSVIKVGESFVFGALSFSKDGLWLASGSTSGNVSLWDPFTGEKAMAVGKHESNVYTVGFGSDLRTLTSGGDDGLGIQWELRRGAEKWTSEPDELWKVLQTGQASDAFEVIQSLSAKPDVAVELIERKLNGVRILADPIVERDRAELYAKMVDENEQLEYAVAVRRAITVLEQTEGEKARSLLKQFAQRGPEDPIGRLALAALWGKAKP